MKRFSKGFTLVEVLVAVFVFGVMTTLAYATLGQTLSNAELLTERMDRLKAIQRAVRIIDADLMQTAPRPIRDPLTGNSAPAFRSEAGYDFALELTRSGWNNPAGLKRSTQQRSAYRLEDDELVRYHWIVLDRTLANEPRRAVLLDGVENFELRYLTLNGEWSGEWPPFGSGANDRIRPRAVEMLLTLADEGEIRRVLEVAP